jgi:O-antigen/teichoic acid export membrane protein
MSIVRHNIIANVAGRGWSALLSLAIVPLYIHFLGIEAYGLIGFFLSLMAILSLLDLGLGTALNRQFAHYSAQPGRAQEMRDLLRTLEIIYWLIGIAIGAAMAALAPVIAAYWIKPQQLSGETVTQALAMMGIALAFQWPRALYTGGLMGMQRQVAFNLLSSITGSVNSIGGVLVVWLVSPTIQAFVAWSMAASLVDTLLTGLLLRRSLPKAPARPAFSRKLLADIWRFAAGMTGISVMSVILTQLDKMILVKVLPLDAFGYYSLASRVAGGIFLTGPICAAFFPRFSQLLLTNDRQQLAYLYHRGCQLLSVLVLPLAVVLALFSYEFLLLWTRDRQIAENSYLVLSLLTAGTALNALASMPHVLQLAWGWTRLSLIANTSATLLLAPLIYLMSVKYGGVGAAIVWVIFNALYILVVLYLMHRRLLQGELWRWYHLDIGRPLLAAAAVGGIGKWLIPFSETVWSSLANLILVSAATFAAATIAAPEIRTLAIRWLTPTPRSVK